MLVQIVKRRGLFEHIGIHTYAILHTDRHSSQKAPRHGYSNPLFCCPKLSTAVGECGVNTVPIVQRDHRYIGGRGLVGYTGVGCSHCALTLVQGHLEAITAVVSMAEVLGVQHLPTNERIGKYVAVLMISSTTNE
jgi:hypothetical protein